MSELAIGLLVTVLGGAVLAAGPWLWKRLRSGDEENELLITKAAREAVATMTDTLAALQQERSRNERILAEQRRRIAHQEQMLNEQTGRLAACTARVSHLEGRIQQLQTRLERKEGHA